MPESRVRLLGEMQASARDQPLKCNTPAACRFAITALSLSVSRTLLSPTLHSVFLDLSQAAMAEDLDYEKGIEPKDNEIRPSTNTDIPSGHSESLKIINDGHTVLIPQPSTDPNDPLNWSQSKKNTILLIVSATAFLADFGSSMGAVTSVVQSNLL